MATVSEALAIAVQHHQAGRLQAAQQIYRQILAVEPNHADAIHLLGVVALQAGNPEVAVEHIERAVRLQGGAAFYHNNLGEAYLAVHRIPEAAACYRRAVELKPDYVEAHNNLGVALTRLGKLDEAVACCRRALELAPDFTLAHNNLGNALREQGKPDEAVACYRRALELKPDYAEAHNNLGAALTRLGRLDEAVACCRRAVELNPDHAEGHNDLGNALKEQGGRDESAACYRRALELKPDFAEAHTNLGNVLREQGKLDEAVACYRRALELKPELAEVHVNLGVAFREQGKLDEAVACCRRALELKPDFATAHNNLGDALKDLGKPDEAAGCCRRALELQPDLAEAHASLGDALREQGKLNAAVACCRRALELKPDLVHAHCGLGSALEEAGDLQGAEDSFRAALRHDPRCTFAHYKLVTLLGGAMLGQELDEQRRLLQETKLTDRQRSFLHFGLAGVLDARGEYAEAAGHLERANALQLSEWRRRDREYDPREHELCVNQMIDVCTPEFFRRVRGFGSESDLPVFVMGLPRSGTTLIEQILASHSQISGAGEIKLAGDTMLALGGQGVDPADGLRRMDRETARRLASQYLVRLRACSSSALRIVDKTPDNYLLLGLLACLFPRAKLILCRRDLRDVAVSCWMTDFQEIRWTNSQPHIVSRFHQYRRILDHWRKVLPAPLLEVDYEETVADLEGIARRLVAWCGLAWEASCLKFHQSKRPVRTASVVQVRKPLYGTSVGRWKHYEQALASLFSAISGG